jgi:beta-xylosidase
MNKLILILTTLCFLAGCGTTKGYEEILRTWVGHNANDLVASWGYPKNSFKASNGNTVYVYSSSGSYTMPTQTNSTYNLYGNTVYGQSTTTGGQTLNFACTTYFEIDNSNRVVRWSWEGNKCRA